MRHKIAGVLETFPLVHPTFKEQPEIKQLLASPQYTEIQRLLEGRKVAPAFREEPLGDLIVEAARRGLRKATWPETLTKGERKKLADRVMKASAALKSALAPFLQNDNIFQPTFDGLACDVAYEEFQFLQEAGVALDEDTVHRCRYAVYRLLMDGLPNLLDLISNDAEAFSEQETILKQPNDANADRLRFIRRATSFFGLAFNSPMRAATLELTSVYFDCDGLTEASISTLAPIWKKAPATITMPAEAMEQFRALAGKAGIDFEKFEAEMTAARQEAQEFYGE